MGEIPSPQQEALTALLVYLRAEAYAFTAITPLTHQQVLRNRGGAPATSLRDIFGWSLPFAPQQLPAKLLQADALVRPAISAPAGLLTSHVRGG